MNKIILLSLVTATLIFTGCGEKETTSDATTKAVESTKAAASDVVDAAKEAAEKAAVKAQEAADAIKKSTHDAVEATKEAADKAAAATKEAADKAVVATTEAVEEVKSEVTSALGAQAYKKCSGCHGADGKTKALGKSPVIAGLAKDDLVTMLKEYKAGTRNVAGMGALMKGQVATMSDADIEAVSAHISAL